MNFDDVKDTSIGSIKNISKDSILEALGLDNKPATSDYVLPVMGIFAVGLLSGLAAGFILAPQSGRKTRNQVEGAVDDARDKAMGKMRDASEAVAN